IDNAAVLFTATAPKSEIAFEGCEINNGSVGIFKRGVSTDVPDRKTTISGTTFFNQSETGLALVNEDAPVISNNVVSAISTQKGFKAIYLCNASNNLIISKNIINTP